MKGQYKPPIPPTEVGASLSVSDSSPVSYVKTEVKYKTKKTMKILTEEDRRRREEELKARDLRITIIYAIVASISMMSSLAAMYRAYWSITYLMGIIPLFTAPYVVRQRRKLNMLPSLRDEHNKLRAEANNLMEQNHVLSVETTKLQRRVTRLKEMEENFNSIVRKEGHTLDTFRALMKENKKIQAEINKHMEAQIMEDLLLAVIGSDRDKNFHIDEEEMDSLIMRLRYHEQINVNEKKLRSTFAASGTKSMATLVEVARALMDGDVLALEAQSE